MQPFQVFARLRPLSSKEEMMGGEKTLSVVGPGCLGVGQRGREAFFQLDEVYQQHAENHQIFEEVVQPLLDSFLEGINSTVLAYGITGAGKSFTMFGDGYNLGLISLALQYLCSQNENIKLGLSYMEIYNQQVFDLLQQKSQSLAIQDDPLLGVVVSDLKEAVIMSPETALDLIAQGNHRRVVAETKANQFSSRSHAIVQITMERENGQQIVTSKLSLVDLAGSQRQNVYNDIKGIRNFEGSNINRSLLTLGNCITLLSQKKKGFVPYRDSKLTRLLKDSLGGNTRTVMIACVSPSWTAQQETINTLKYACRARKIQKTVIQNVKQPRSNQEMKRQIVRLRKELQDVRRGCIPIDKEQMQQLLQQLIRATEELTELKMGGSQLLDHKMKQVDLIQQQRNIVNQIVAKCKVDYQPANQKVQRVKMARCNTVNFDENRKKVNTLVHQSPRVSGLFIDRSNRPSFLLQKINQNSQFMDKSTQPSLQMNMLQDYRSKYRQVRTSLQNIFMDYYHNYQNAQNRQTAAFQITQLLPSVQSYLSSQESALVAKVQRREPLTWTEVGHYNNKWTYESYVNKQNESQRSQAVPRNRFLSSLEQVRRMTQMVSNQMIFEEPLQTSYYEQVTVEQ